ncbi:MAG: C4-dicarboxylate ABC transporter substrate-binding protein [Deltaproteobacteria bacterium]|nr:MAG: C4-dicarboxylate ABC transporter substrate-binding protein [Deltaproteobacteria bacterium]
MKRLLLLVVAFFLMMPIGNIFAGEKPDYVNIGTASMGGSYYPTGGYICNVVNKSRKKYGHNIRCSVESTGGSIANLRAIQAGDLNVGMAMASSQLSSWNGTGKMAADGPNKKLRFLFSIVEEPMHVVARKDANIKSFADLKGKVVNTGAVGSGTEAQVYHIVGRYGENPEKFFKQETKLTTREQATALCDGKIDAFVWVTAVGAATITEAANTCDVDLVPLNDEVIQKMVAERSDAAEMIIPAGAYKGIDKDVVSWGAPGTVVASADVPEETIYYLVKGVFDDIERFKQQSPMYKNLTREWAATAGMTAPYHPGALKYYKEVGLVQ